MSVESDIPIALRAAYLMLHRQSEAAFHRHGVTADQFVLLASLSRGHALTQRELARRMSSDPSTVRAMLVLMERQGLVERDTHATDARARTVSLTATGKRMFRKLWTAGVPIRERMIDALRPGEAETLIRLLSQMTVALERNAVRAGDWNSTHSPHEDGS